jgi:hypothetical protein
VCFPASAQAYYVDAAISWLTWLAVARGQRFSCAPGHQPPPTPALVSCTMNQYCDVPPTVLYQLLHPRAAVDFPALSYAPPILCKSLLALVPGEPWCCHNQDAGYRVGFGWLGDDCQPAAERVLGLTGFSRRRRAAEAAHSAPSAHLQLDGGGASAEHAAPQCSVLILTPSITPCPRPRSSKPTCTFVVAARQMEGALSAVFQDW